jgi:hypothetical protein
MKRIPSQLERIVKALREAGLEGVTNIELVKLSLKYDARISDLRRKGFVIDVEPLGKGIYKYILVKMPSDIKFFRNATEETLEAIDQYHGGYISRDDFELLLDLKGFQISRKHGWYRDYMKIN